MSQLQIIEEELTGRKIAEFLREHLQDMSVFMMKNSFKSKTGLTQLSQYSAGA